MPIVTNRLLITGAAALLALGLAGCSSDSATMSPTDAASPAASMVATPVASPAASPAMSASMGSGATCAAADAAQASLQTVRDTQIVKEGTDTLKANFAAFQTDAQVLIEAARADFAPQTDAVQASIVVLRTAVDNLTQSPTLADAAAVAVAIKPVQASLLVLVTSVRTAC